VTANFEPLSSLLGDDLEGRQPAQKAGSIDAFKNGAPTLADGTPDYATMARTYYQLGDMGTATQLARLAQRANLRFAYSNDPNLNIDVQADDGSARPDASGDRLAAAGDLKCDGFSAGCQSGGSYGTTATHNIEGRNVCTSCAVKMMGVGGLPGGRQLLILKPFELGQ